MSYSDNSKPSDEAGQAIRRLPTGLYELSPSLLRPQPTLRHHQPPRFGEVLYTVFALFVHISLDKTGPGWKVVKPLLVASVMVLIGIVCLVMFSVEMVGTIPKLPVETKSPGPAAEANGSGNDDASIERLGRGRVTAPTKVAQPTATVRAEWLIDNVAKAGRDPRLRKRTPTWLPATTASADTQGKAPVGSRSLDDEERGPDEAVGSGGKPAAVNFDDSTNSELRSSQINRMSVQRRSLDAHHTARRRTIKSARRKGGYGSYWDRFFQPWPYW
jgi:hypothetical protein